MTWLGVLNGQVAHGHADALAGFNLVEIEVGWASWEPTEGQVNQSYINTIVSDVQQYKAAGYTVIVSAGLFNAPAWAVAKGAYIDQSGHSSNSPNWNSPSVRSAAQLYLDNLIPALGGNVDAYRIGLSPSGEMWYPPTSTNQWWAFDSTAQASCPMPGWIPGTATYHGVVVIPSQAESWYLWYVGLLNAAHAWEVSALRAASWSGFVTYNIGGVGLTPTIYTAAMNALLAQNVWWSNVANLGVAWNKVIPTLDHSQFINCTSVYDGSGTPVNNSSQPGDASLTIAQADPTVSHWSAARWIAYLGRASGFTNFICESVGNSSNEMASQVAGTMSQAHACGNAGILWANDLAMWDGVHATAAQVAAGYHAAFG